MPPPAAAQIDAIAPAWEELAERTGASPFLRPGWFSTWAEAFAEAPLELLTTRKKGRLAAVLPYLRTDDGVRSATNAHSHALGLLAEDEDAAREVTGELFSIGARVSLAYVDAAGTESEICREAAQAAGYLVVTRPLAYGLFMRLEGDWASFERSLPARLVRDVKRRRRRLEQLGDVALEVADGSERLDELLEEGFRLETSGWKAAEQTAILSARETRRFYESIARWAADRGWLRLFFLRLEGRPVAFQFALEEGGAHFFLKGGYDPELHSYSPGKLLLHATLTHAFEQGLERYELLGDVEPWKLEWTRTMRERVSFEAFRRSPRGLAGYAALAYLRPLLRSDRRRRLLER